MAQIGLLAYGETERKDFPVLVIFGREANNSGNTEYVVDRYDWQLSPRSVFWNTAYGLAARCCGVDSGMSLKRACEAAGGSPLVFANCSPVPILNSEGAKDAIRSAVGASAIEQHIAEVFSLIDRHFPGRLAGVITSVGDEFRFALVARTKVAAESKKRGVPHIDLPYMRQGVRSESLVATIGSPGVALMRSAFAPLTAGSITKPSVPHVRAAQTPLRSQRRSNVDSRMYEDLVGVGVYCDWIDGDLRGSPFMPLDSAKSPRGLRGLDHTGTASLQRDGFFLVDSSGAIVDDNSGGEARFVIATHVAQRERGGRFPRRFNRVRGRACGFGSTDAKKLSRAAAPAAIGAAWKAWMH